MSDLRRVWVTRAQPGAERTAERLSALGFTPFVTPLLTLRTLDVHPDLTGIDALAFTSRNAVTAFTENVHHTAFPVFAVGDATADAARTAGFTDVRSADGDLHALAALIRKEGVGLSILHPGAAEPAGDLAALVGDVIRVTTLAIYEVFETVVPAPDDWDAVLIHSPRAARALASRISPDAAKGRIACAISSAAAAALTTLPFVEIRIAATPTEAGLLATLGKPQVSV